MSVSVRPHPWDSPGKNTGVGCHFLLQCIKVKSESEVAQSCPTLRDPMDCSLPGSSVHGIFQARVLEWGAIAFSVIRCRPPFIRDSQPGHRDMGGLPPVRAPGLPCKVPHAGDRAARRHLLVTVEATSRETKVPPLKAPGTAHSLPLGSGSPGALPPPSHGLSVSPLRVSYTDICHWI